MKEGIERFGQDPYEFIIEKFRKGYTHMLLGENHSSRAIHRFTANLVERLAEDLTDITLCLEQESFLQGAIDQYMEDGKPDSFKNILEREKQLTKQGISSGARLNSEYYNIIKVAQKCKLPIIVIDRNLDGTSREEICEYLLERDSFMGERIPKNKSCLVYVGAGHIMKDNNAEYSIYEILKNNGINAYSILQEDMRKECCVFTKDFNKKMYKFLNETRAFDLKEIKLQEMLDWSIKDLKIINMLYNMFDGLIFHTI